jgi:PcfJ-like protein
MGGTAQSCLERSMGTYNRKLSRKRYRARLAQRRRDGQIARAVLKSHSQFEAASAIARAPACFDDLSGPHREKFRALRGYALRAPEDWRCRIKSKSPEKRFLDFVRFCFARYRVAAHLEEVWIADVIGDDFVDKVTVPGGVDSNPGRAPDFMRWYLIAAQGGSLYKQEASRYLSKQECHHFLTAPDEVGSLRAAMWYAVARAQAERKDAALKVARSKITGYSIASSWWKDVARFFARNPTTVHEINDFVDFLFVAKQEDEAYTLKGRTLATLRRRMEDWHRTLRKSQTIGGGAWAGNPLPDAEYKTGKDHHQAIWRFRQIKTGNELFREGERMHHCVAGYKFACMQGYVSIWSLTSEFPIGRVNRGVTIEVTKGGHIVQCRGFANRLPYANEVTMAKRWAAENNLTWASLER